MISRLARLVLGLALVALPGLTVVPSAGAAAGPAYTIKGPSRFSPNG